MSLSVFFGLGIGSASMSIQDPPEPRGREEVDVTAPGPVHRALQQQMSGEWVTTSVFRLAPDQTSEPATGKAVIKPILGGRFLQEEHEDAIMGEPTQSVRLLGYSTAGKRYEATWMYTGATSMLRLVGTSPDNGNTLHLTGEYDDETGERATLRVTIRFADDDTFTVALHSPPAEGEALAEADQAPMLETRYARRQPPG